MFKRAFFLTVGLGCGLLVGAYVVRKMESARRSVSPANLGDRAGRAAGDLAGRLRVMREDARAAAAAREAQLRAEFNLPTIREARRRS